jgi:adenylate kinase family enzyme
MKFKGLPLRLFTVFLTVLLFATNSILAYAPETNFWKERSKFVRSETEPIQVASLPSLPSLPVFHNGEARWGINGNPINTPPNLPTARHGEEFLLNIPSAYGSIRKISPSAKASGDKSNSRVVIHIQDVHLNAEAQGNIGQAVQSLIDSGKVDLIALEGAFGPIELNQYRQFENKKAVRIAANYLLRENRISGPIHTALTSHAAIPLITGIDDKAHYDANVEAYRQSAGSAEKIKRQITRIEKAVQQQKMNVFNPELKALDAKIQAYRNGQMGLGEYLSGMSNAAWGMRPGTNRTPHTTNRFSPVIETFLSAYAIEKSLNFSQVEAERTQLITALVNRLSKNQISDLTQMTMAYRAGQVRHTDFYSYLKNLCEKSGVQLAHYKAMNGYLQYVLLSDSIDSEKLIQETRKLEEETLASLIRSEQEKDLIDQSKQIYLAGKLADFSLTKEEWGEYKAFANSKSQTLNSNPSMDSNLGFEISNLQLFEDFYRMAEARDQAMAENLQQSMDKSKAKVAILITGGFHSNGIDSALRSQNPELTMVSFVPKLTKVDTADGSSYLSVFAQEKTPLDQLFLGEKLFLTPPPAQVGLMTPLTRAADIHEKNPAVNPVTVSGTNRTMKVRFNSIDEITDVALQTAWSEIFQKYKTDFIPRHNFRTESQMFLAWTSLLFIHTLSFTFGFIVFKDILLQAPYFYIPALVFGTAVTLISGFAFQFVYDEVLFIASQIAQNQGWYRASDFLYGSALSLPQNQESPKDFKPEKPNANQIMIMGFLFATLLGLLALMGIHDKPIPIPAPAKIEFSDFSRVQSIKSKDDIISLMELTYQYLESKKYPAAVIVKEFADYAKSNSVISPYLIKDLIYISEEIYTNMPPKIYLADPRAFNDLMLLINESKSESLLIEHMAALIVRQAWQWKVCQTLPNRKIVTRAHANLLQHVIYGPVDPIFLQDFIKPLVAEQLTDFYLQEIKSIEFLKWAEQAGIFNRKKTLEEAAMTGNGFIISRTVQDDVNNTLWEKHSSYLFTEVTRIILNDYMALPGTQIFVEKHGDAHQMIGIAYSSLDPWKPFLSLQAKQASDLNNSLALSKTDQEYLPRISTLDTATKKVLERKIISLGLEIYPTVKANLDRWAKDFDEKMGVNNKPNPTPHNAPLKRATGRRGLLDLGRRYIAGGDLLISFPENRPSFGFEQSKDDGRASRLIDRMEPAIGLLQTACEKYWDKFLSAQDAFTIKRRFGEGLQRIRISFVQDNDRKVLMTRPGDNFIEIDDDAINLHPLLFSFLLNHELNPTESEALTSDLLYYKWIKGNNLKEWEIAMAQHPEISSQPYFHFLEENYDKETAAQGIAIAQFMIDHSIRELCELIDARAGPPHIESRERSLLVFNLLKDVLRTMPGTLAALPPFIPELENLLRIPFHDDGQTRETIKTKFLKFSEYIREKISIEGFPNLLFPFLNDIASLGTRNGHNIPLRKTSSTLPAPGQISDDLARKLIQDEIRGIGFFGKAGVGKGTQSLELAKQLNSIFKRIAPDKKVEVLSSGEYFRAINRILLNRKDSNKYPLKQGDEQFQDLANLVPQWELEQRMYKGLMMSDSTTIKIMNAVLSRDQFKKAWLIIFDGFPRTPRQFRIIQNGQINSGRRAVLLDLNFVIDGDDEILLRRIIERANKDLKTGVTRPDAPIDLQTGKVDEKATRAIFETRAKTYEKTTKPVVDAVKTEPYTIEVSGTKGTEEEVRQDLIKKLEAYLNSPTNSKNGADQVSRHQLMSRTENLPNQKLPTIIRNSILPSILWITTLSILTLGTLPAGAAGLEIFTPSDLNIAFFTVISAGLLVVAVTVARTIRKSILLKNRPGSEILADKLQTYQNLLYDRQLDPQYKITIMIAALISELYPSPKKLSERSELPTRKSLSTGKKLFHPTNSQHSIRVPGPILAPAIGDSIEDVLFRLEGSWSNPDVTFRTFQSDHYIFNDNNFRFRKDGVFISAFSQDKADEKEIFFSLLNKYDLYEKSEVKVIVHKKTTHAELMTFEVKLKNGTTVKFSFLKADIMTVNFNELGITPLGMIYASNMGWSNSLSGSSAFWHKMAQLLSSDGFVYMAYGREFGTGNTLFIKPQEIEGNPLYRVNKVGQITSTPDGGLLAFRRSPEAMNQLLNSKDLKIDLHSLRYFLTEPILQFLRNKFHGQFKDIELEKLIEFIRAFHDRQPKLDLSEKEKEIVAQLLDIALVASIKKLKGSELRTSMGAMNIFLSHLPIPLLACLFVMASLGIALAQTTNPAARPQGPPEVSASPFVFEPWKDRIPADQPLIEKFTKLTTVARTNIVNDASIPANKKAVLLATFDKVIRDQRFVVISAAGPFDNHIAWAQKDFIVVNRVYIEMGVSDDEITAILSHEIVHLTPEQQEFLEEARRLMLLLPTNQADYFSGDKFEENQANLKKYISLMVELELEAYKSQFAAAELAGRKTNLSAGKYYAELAQRTKSSLLKDTYKQYALILNDELPATLGRPLDVRIKLGLLYPMQIGKYGLQQTFIQMARADKVKSGKEYAAWIESWLTKGPSTIAPAAPQPSKATNSLPDKPDTKASNVNSVLPSSVWIASLSFLFLGMNSSQAAEASTMLASGISDASLPVAYLVGVLIGALPFAYIIYLKHKGELRKNWLISLMLIIPIIIWAGWMGAYELATHSSWLKPTQQTTNTSLSSPASNPSTPQPTGLRLSVDGFSPSEAELIGRRFETVLKLIYGNDPGLQADVQKIMSSIDLEIWNGDPTAESVREGKVPYEPLASHQKPFRIQPNGRYQVSVVLRTDLFDTEAKLLPPLASVLYKFQLELQKQSYSQLPLRTRALIKRVIESSQTPSSVDKEALKKHLENLDKKPIPPPTKPEERKSNQLEAKSQDGKFYFAGILGFFKRGKKKEDKNEGMTDNPETLLKIIKHTEHVQRNIPETIENLQFLPGIGPGLLTLYVASGNTPINSPTAWENFSEYEIKDLALALIELTTNRLVNDTSPQAQEMTTNLGRMYFALIQDDYICAVEPSNGVLNITPKPVIDQPLFQPESKLKIRPRGTGLILLGSIFLFASSALANFSQITTPRTTELSITGRTNQIIFVTPTKKIENNSSPLVYFAGMWGLFGNGKKKEEPQDDPETLEKIQVYANSVNKMLSSHANASALLPAGSSSQNPNNLFPGLKFVPVIENNKLTIWIDLGFDLSRVNEPNLNLLSNDPTGDLAWGKMRSSFDLRELARLLLSLELNRLLNHSTKESDITREDIRSILELLSDDNFHLDITNENGTLIFTPGQPQSQTQPASGLKLRKPGSTPAAETAASHPAEDPHTTLEQEITKLNSRIKEYSTYLGTIIDRLPDDAKKKMFPHSSEIKFGPNTVSLDLEFSSDVSENGSEAAIRLQLMMWVDLRASKKAPVNLKLSGASLKPENIWADMDYPRLFDLSRSLIRKEILTLQKQGNLSSGKKFENLYATLFGDPQTILGFKISAVDGSLHVTARNEEEPAITFGKTGPIKVELKESRPAPLSSAGAKIADNPQTPTQSIVPKTAEAAPAIPHNSNTPHLTEDDLIPFRTAVQAGFSNPGPHPITHLAQLMALLPAKAESGHLLAVLKIIQPFAGFGSSEILSQYREHAEILADQDKLNKAERAAFFKLIEDKKTDLGADKDGKIKSVFTELPYFIPSSLPLAVGSLISILLTSILQPVFRYLDFDFLMASSFSPLIIIPTAATIGIAFIIARHEFSENGAFTYAIPWEVQQFIDSHRTYFDQKVGQFIIDQTEKENSWNDYSNYLRARFYRFSAWTFWGGLSIYLTTTVLTHFLMNPDSITTWGQTLWTMTWPVLVGLFGGKLIYSGLHLHNNYRDRWQSSVNGISLGASSSTVSFEEALRLIENRSFSGSFTPWKKIWANLKTTNDFIALKLFETVSVWPQMPANEVFLRLDWPLNHPKVVLDAKSKISAVRQMIAVQPGTDFLDPKLDLVLKSLSRLEKEIQFIETVLKSQPAPAQGKPNNSAFPFIRKDVLGLPISLALSDNELWLLKHLELNKKPKLKWILAKDRFKTERKALNDSMELRTRILRDVKIPDRSADLRQVLDRLSGLINDLEFSITKEVAARLEKDVQRATPSAMTEVTGVTLPLLSDVATAAMVSVSRSQMNRLMGLLSLPPAPTHLESALQIARELNLLNGNPIQWDFSQDGNLKRTFEAMWLWLLPVFG